MIINIFGWIIGDDDLCQDCGHRASFVVISAVDEDGDFFTLCNDCLERDYVVYQDLVADAFVRALGMLLDAFYNLDDEAPG
jgi:hypothetical protein